MVAGVKELGGWDKFKNFFGDMSMASDASVRNAIYTLALEQGLSKREAIEKAVEIINFRRHGASAIVQSLNRVIPFFNAYLQSMHVMINVIRGEGISPGDRKAALKNLATLSAGCATFSMLYSALNGGDNDYENTDSSIRDRHLMFGGMMIPLRTDMFLMPKVVGEHLYRYMTDAEDGSKTRQAMGTAFANAILGPTAVPQVIKPALEVMTNHDFFTGNPIIGAHLQGLEKSEQQAPSTSELSKWIGQSNMVAPVVADHLIRGYLGSVGGLMLWATNHLMPGVQRPDSSAWDAMQTIPGMSAFMAKEYGSGFKNDFYDLASQVNQVVNTYNALNKYDSVKAMEYLGKDGRQELYDMASTTNRIQTELGNTRLQANQIYNDPNMTGEQKKAMLDEIKKTELQLLKAEDITGLRRQAGM
jgi:hypothetical protein